MDDHYIATEREGAVLVITMDRPKVNAINHAMSRALYAAFRELQDTPELMVGILCSASERVFSAGWDLKEVAAGDYHPEVYFDPVVGHGPGGFAGIVENWQLNKPVIAAVRGAAVGGGFEMCLACDMILASDDAYFQLPELVRGFLPDAGGIQRLPRQLPPKVAAELMMTGRRMPAEEAARWGLVHAVMPSDQVQARAKDTARTIAKSAPLALQGLKAMLRMNEGLSVEESMKRARPGNSGVPVFEQMIRSEDFFEGSRAFVERREPKWKGS
jgi:crotonobetainyl-CoA hydratase